MGAEFVRLAACRPNLFVIGAMKAGTTSLYRMLAAHPDVFMSPVKEPNYFADLAFRGKASPRERFVFSEYLASSERKLRHSAPVWTIEEYEALFRDGAASRYRGEASPSYLHSVGAPREIAAYSPDAKIIVLLRDPIERANSHYRMDVTIGRVNVSFTEAIRRELAGQKVGSGKGYLAMSCYSEALMRWLEVLPREQIKVVSYRELFSPSGGGRDELAKFLQLDAMQFGSVKEQHNKTNKPRFGRLNYLLHGSEAKKWLREFVPHGLKEAAKRWFYVDDPGELVPERTRGLLTEYFEADTAAMKGLFGERLFAKKT